ncbi:hypothetical protein [Sphingobacterium puteale]|uniref:hypothetical protein n=1 Tax=Sphingobacterium puteale TaxID=2420510 RepID=UPI003D975A90
MHQLKRYHNIEEWAIEFVGTPILVGFTILYLHKSARRCNVLNEVDFSPSSILAAFQL